MTEQMKIFRKMLDDRGIKWEDASEENSVLPITRGELRLMWLRSFRKKN